MYIALYWIILVYMQKYMQKQVVNLWRFAGNLGEFGFLGIAVIDLEKHNVHKCSASEILWWSYTTFKNVLHVSFRYSILLA
jgi:hypothetical protein